MKKENEEKGEVKDSNVEKIKLAVVILVGLIALYLLITYNLTQKYYSLAGEKVSYKKALEDLSTSPRICIVEELSNVVDPIRKNIMNCGVNFASTIPLKGRAVSVYAFEDGTCYTEGGEKKIEECVKEIKNDGCYILYITSNQTNELETYDNLMVVPVGEELKEGECRIE